jgi:hypothetical protein
MKKPSVKNLYVRLISGGKVLSVGEYINASFRSLETIRLNPDDSRAIAELQGIISSFRKRTGRLCDFVAYRGDSAALQTVLALHEWTDMTFSTQIESNK